MGYSKYKNSLPYGLTKTEWESREENKTALNYIKETPLTAIQREEALANYWKKFETDKSAIRKAWAEENRRLENLYLKDMEEGCRLGRFKEKTVASLHSLASEKYSSLSEREWFYNDIVDILETTL